MENHTPYLLHRLSATVSEETHYTREHEDPEIPPGSHDGNRISNDVFAHGLAMVITYGVYDPTSHAFLGMVITKSGIDCTKPTPVTGCLDYHRWENATVDSGQVVRVEWGDNSGPPSDYVTFMRIFPDKPPHSPPPPARVLREVSIHSPGVNEAPGLPVPWVVNAGFSNQSPFELRLRMVWSSEDTQFENPLTHARFFPPDRIPSGYMQPLAWAYINYTQSHGPSAVVMYDAFDTRTHQYVGSVVAEAAVDCIGGNPRTGCLSWHSWSDLVTGAVKGYRLEGEAKSTGLPPFEFAALFGVRGEIGGPGSRPPDRSFTG